MIAHPQPLSEMCFFHQNEADCEGSSLLKIQRLKSHKL